MLLSLLYSITITGNSQQHYIDSLSKLLTAPQHDTTLVNIYFDLGRYSGKDSALYYFDKAVELSEKLNAGRDIVNFKLYRAFILHSTGRFARALDDILTARKLAEAISDTIGLIHTYNEAGRFYVSAEHEKRAVHEYREGFRLARIVNSNEWILYIAHNVGELYVNLNVPDSAMYFFQESYKASSNYSFPYTLALVNRGMGRIHTVLGNPDIALPYLHKGLKYAKEDGNDYTLATVYRTLAQAHRQIGRNDSSIYYAKKQLQSAIGDEHIPLTLHALKQLSAMYEGKNNDSAVKYFKLGSVLRDSVYTSQKRIDVESLGFSEEQRREESIALEQKQQHERERYLQFALIGVGLIAFVLIFLLLSQSIIVKSGLVKFLGIVALLLVFEFINLLIHPFIGDFTHHSPLWMFLIMVCIAGLLVPAHHRLEKWITHQLVEKNKRIRLASAKKTILDLEG